MRILYPLVFVLFGTLWIASMSQSKEPVCDQKTYDMVYRSILRKALRSSVSISDINEKNDAIENLRILCRGQKSTLETKNNNYNTQRETK